MNAIQTKEAAQQLRDQMDAEANQLLSESQLANYLYLRDVCLRWLEPDTRKLFIKHLTEVDRLCDSTSPDTTAK
jgi:hypothetical protein